MPSVYQDALNRARSGVFRPGPDATYADGDDSAWMGVDWPALTKRLKVEGRDVNVVDTGGDGPPLLWIHGLGGIWQNWLLNIPVVHGHAPLRGHRPAGLRPVGAAGRGCLDPRFAETVDAVCDELGIEEPVVVGNSMGGFVGAELALSFPTRRAQARAGLGGGAFDRVPGPRAAARRRARSSRC